MSLGKAESTAYVRSPSGERTGVSVNTTSKGGHKCPCQITPHSIQRLKQDARV